MTLAHKITIVIVLTTFLYLYVAHLLFKDNQVGLALSYAFYAAANVGLLLASRGI